MPSSTLLRAVDKNESLSLVFATLVRPLDSRGIFVVTLFTESDPAARFRVDE